jgi:type I restriction-modification system DNA methylase subunit
MRQKARAMLENLYGAFHKKFREPSKAWDSFVEFLIADHKPIYIYQFQHKFEWLFNDSKLTKAIQDIYDPFLLWRDFNDHLGAIYFENIISKKEASNKGLSPTPMHLAEEISRINIPKTMENPIIFDPAMGTGRVLMAAYQYAPDSRLFGVTKDIRSMRIALTNFAIYDIPGYLLNADSLNHEIDIAKESGRYNWSFANRWHSCMHKLKPSANRTKSQINLYSGSSKNKK